MTAVVVIKSLVCPSLAKFRVENKQTLKMDLETRSDPKKISTGVEFDKKITLKSGPEIVICSPNRIIRFGLKIIIRVYIHP